MLQCALPDDRRSALSTFDTSVEGRYATITGGHSIQLAMDITDSIQEQVSLLDRAKVAEIVSHYV